MEETNINEENPEGAALPEVVEQPIAMDTIAISHALHAVLSRQYLDRPLGEIIQPLPLVGAPRTEPAVFLHLTQIGKPLTNSAGDALTALQNVLTACHAPGRFTLIFLLASDGKHNNSIYLGAQSHDSRFSAQTFLRSVGNFLEANWPGTQLTTCTPSDDTFSHQVEGPLKREDFVAVAMTGVPSLKAGEHSGYPQTLDRLLNGMRGSPFLYMVIAEPIGGEEVDSILYRCRDLMSEIHTFAKTALTLSDNVQYTMGGGGTTGKYAYKEETTNTGHTRNVGARAKLVFANLQIGARAAYQITERKTRMKGDMDLRTHSNLWSIALGSSESLGQEYINAHAQAVEIQLHQYLERFEQSRALGCWNVGAYLFAEKEDLVQQGAMQIKALLTGEKSIYEPVRTHELYSVWVEEVKSPLGSFQQPTLGLVSPLRERVTKPTHADRVEHLLGPHFSGLTTPLNTEELALLTNLPQREIAGIPVADTASFSLNVSSPQPNDVILGNLLDGGKETSVPYPIPLQTLVKHTLVTGITGSGKSNTCLRLLGELQRQDVPFLVIEPAKDEYVEWAMRINASLPPEKRIRIYMPGVAAWQGQPLTYQLRLNPLDVVWLSEQHTPPVLSHVDRLKSILNASFPMQEVLPILLEDVLFAAYSKPFNWLEDVLPPFDTPRPTLRQMFDIVRDVIRQKGYEEQITSNLTAALMTRIQSLRRGWKGQLFDQPRSTAWKDIFDRPVVINLSQLGDDADRAFAMAVLLQFLYEYRQAQFDTDTSRHDGTRHLQHLTVVEEAHRVLQNATPGMPAQANPQGKVAEMFSNVLSEIRAYGEGLLIVDQVPARLVPDAIKNTNLKIVHRLVANDDREAMSGCMTLVSEQTALINRLRVGQAIIYGDQDNTAAWVQVASHDDITV